MNWSTPCFHDSNFQFFWFLGCSKWWVAWRRTKPDFPKCRPCTVYTKSKFMGGKQYGACALTIGEFLPFYTLFCHSQRTFDKGKKWRHTNFMPWNLKKNNVSPSTVCSRGMIVVDKFEDHEFSFYVNRISLFEILTH